MSRTTLLTSAVTCVLLSTVLPARAEWYIVPNPTTGAPQAVWSSTSPEQGDEEIVYSYLNGGAWASSAAFTATAYADQSLVVATDPAGILKVAWGTDEALARVLARSLTSAGGSWGPEIVVSDPQEASSAPSIVVHAGSVHVVYMTTAGSGARSIKCGKIDVSGSVERSVVRSTALTTHLAPKVHSEAGHLWADWIDTEGSLGYSENMNGLWQAPQYESASGAADHGAARGRIRAHILGL